VSTWPIRVPFNQIHSLTPQLSPELPLSTIPG